MGRAQPQRDYDLVERILVLHGGHEIAEQRWRDRKGQPMAAVRTITRGQRLVIVPTIWFVAIVLAVFVMVTPL
jgi:hypothetical protein